VVQINPFQVSTRLLFNFAKYKCFQELTEQFAEIVIPKVWEKEDRKVARVAKRLSVSPKKVRRILARAGKRKK